MNTTLIGLIAGLFVWMLACGWTGYRARYLLFLGVLGLGMALNTLWMVYGLDAAPLRGPAMAAHMAAFLYGVGSFASGWLIGRIARQWRDSRVEQ